MIITSGVTVNSKHCENTIRHVYLCNWCFAWRRAYVFRAQTQEIKERGGNQTSGIDFYITQERVIFLDTQVNLGLLAFYSSLSITDTGV